MKFSELRIKMVESQIESRGISDSKLLAAMRCVRRHVLVPKNERKWAYRDNPLPIGAGQTISQPYIVAYMIEALNLSGGEKVLEIGTGSGYAAAVLAEIAGEVFTIERVASLAGQAEENLKAEGILNVHVRHADGTTGWAQEAPFDAILVSAAAPEVPQSLKEQLTPGGCMVLPVGSEPHYQHLVRISARNDGGYDSEELAGVSFVPLIGEQGW